MAKVSVLYIEDKIVGPHLALLRNICEPLSKSKPHVTVRFFDKLAIPAGHLNTAVDHIDLLAPGAFGLDLNAEQKNRTIFIRCQSDDLLPLEHKPYFPTSEFHITLYDGTSDQFARDLFKVLNRYSWAFRAILPRSSKLTAIEIKSKARRKIDTLVKREYPPAVMELFHSIFGFDFSEDIFLSLTDKKRLQYADKICKSLQSLTKNFEKIAIPIQKSIVGLDRFPEEEYDIHLTPPELAQEIAAYALKLLGDVPIDFGDPAVGTGAFFAALLKVGRRDSIKSAIGIDISQKQVEAARWRWKSKDMEVREGDYLHMGELPQRNFILANPPYLRHQGIKADYKHELRERASLDIGIRVSALSGQYVYFILLSHKWMAPGAIAAWLIPSEFMQTDYGKALRYYFSKKVQLIRIHQFDNDNPQFENAEVLPCVVVFRNIVPTPDNKVIFSLGGSLKSPNSTEKVGEDRLHPESKWRIQRRTIIERDDTYVKLGDLFSVRRGIATGANSFFVLERDKAKELGIPDIALRPILPKAMNLSSDIVKRKKDGHPNVERQLCVLDSSLSEVEIAEKYPLMMQYLKKGRDEGVLNGYLVSRRSPWYKQEQREPAQFLCTYMGKAHAGKPAIRFIWNKSNAIATNTYLLLYPHTAILKLMKKKPAIAEAIFQLLKASSWQAVGEFSRQHAGGLSKIEPKELQEVWLGPVPQEILEITNKRLF